MLAVEILDAFKKLGITAYVNGDKLVCEPGSKLPPELIQEISEHKAEIMALLSRTACTCNPLPSQVQYGAMAQAGCGPQYERCDTCGHRWQCKFCGGCRYCRSPR
jgi:hypothetical protein